MKLAHILLACTIGLSILLMLLLLTALRLVPLALAGKAVAEGSDVYLFLIGMMLLSELAREQGVFDWAASIAVRSAFRKELRRSIGA